MDFERMRNATDTSRRPATFEVGDQVYLDMRPYPIDRPSKKLSYPGAGPFEIVEKVFGLYRLKLPNSIKVYDIFYPSRLRKDPGTPLDSQVNEPPPAINIIREQEYKVESLLAIQKQAGTLMYRAL
ncbi:unnamed protein product [Diplocarpon coronariae]